MKILSYKHIVFATTLLLTGCIYGDLDKISKDEFRNELTKYCEANHYSFCQIYVQCYGDIFSQLSANTRDSLGIISFAITKPKYNSFNKPENTMGILYSELKYNEEMNKEFLSLDYSYMLYPHNRCSSIIGAKQYDLSRYHKVIEESIEKKQNRMNKK